MRLTVEAFFKVEIWDKRFLLMSHFEDWKKATITNQGLDRVGDSYWVSGIHLGKGSGMVAETSTGVESPITYLNTYTYDKPSTVVDAEKIQFIREFQLRVGSDILVGNPVTELALSWDSDVKTATALCKLDNGAFATDDTEVVVTAKIVVTERLDDIYVGSVDLGASLHNYVLKPCFTNKHPDYYIGKAISQKEGRVYSGEIPQYVTEEPTGSIDVNLGIFDSYSFDTRSKTFKNHFSLSSPNADTRTVTSHTIGLPSAYAIMFDPPIDKEFNRELTLNFQINWDRG